MFKKPLNSLIVAIHPENVPITVQDISLYLSLYISIFEENQ